MKDNDKYIDCLIADFNSIKAEISRRSNLQRIAIVGFLGIVLSIISSSFFKTHSNLCLIFIWQIDLLVLLFIIREKYEISRLGKIIKEKIAKTASKTLQLKEDEIFHSQTSQNGETENTRHYFQIAFNWLLFFIIPITLMIGKFENILSMECLFQIVLYTLILLSGLLITILSFKH